MKHDTISWLNNVKVNDTTHTILIIKYYHILSKREVHSWYKNSPFAVEEGRLSLAGDPFVAMFKDPVDLECWIPNMFSESLVSLLGILLSAKSWKVLPNLILFV